MVIIVLFGEWVMTRAIALVTKSGGLGNLLGSDGLVLAV